MGLHVEVADHQQHGGGVVLALDERHQLVDLAHAGRVVAGGVVGAGEREQVAAGEEVGGDHVDGRERRRATADRS